MRMGNKISLYIPSTVSVGIQVDNQAITDEAIAFFTELFGGATMVKAVGGWMSKEVGLVKEEISIVSFFSYELSNTDIEKVKQYGLDLKESMKQEAISLEINGELLFI